MTFTFSPEYLENLVTTKKHRDFIDGRKKKVEKYLVRYNVEYSQTRLEKGHLKGQIFGDILYQTRVKHLANRNMCEPILVGWLANLTREMSLSKELAENEKLADIMANVNGKNQDLKKFSRDLFWEYLAVGLVGVLVESPLEKEESEINAITRGERSKATLFKSEYIISWERFKEQGGNMGALKEVVLYRTHDGEALYLKRYFIEEGGKYQSQDIKVKTKTNIILESDGNAIPGVYTDYKELEMEEGEIAQGDLDYIPFFILGESCTESVIRNIVEQNEEYLNKKSQYDTINRNQTFKRLLAVGLTAEDIEVWNESVIVATPKTEAKIQEIEAGDPVALEKDLESIEKNCYLEGFLKFNARYQLATAQVESAESKKEDKQTWHDYLNYIADLAEDVLNGIVDAIAEFESAQLEQNKKNVTISREFDSIISQEELNRMELLYSKLNDFGEAGRKAKAEIVCAALAELKFIPEADLSEEEKKTELWKAIREEAQKAQQPSFSVGSNISDVINGGEVPQ